MSKLIVVDPNSPVNTSKQYYWCNGLSLYSNQLNTNQDIEVKDFFTCWDISDAVTGEQIVDAVTGEKIIDY